MYFWLPLLPYLAIPTVAIVLMHFGMSAETAMTLAMAVLAALIA